MSDINGSREDTPPADRAVHQLFDRARTCLQAGDSREALRLAEAALAEEEDFMPALELAGVLACQLGEFERGIQYFSSMAKQAPDHPGALFNLGNALHSAGRSAEALEPLRKADSIAPGNPNLNVVMGMALRKLGQLDEAEQRLRKAVEAAPQHVPALNALGNVQVEQGRFLEARDTFLQAIKIAPRSVELRHNLGNLMLELGEFRAAAEEYRGALTLEPRHPDARAGLGAALNGLGQYEEALYHLEKALKHTPDHPTAHYAIIDTLEYLGRVDEARTRLERLRADAPQDPNLAFLGARLEMRQGRPDEARACIDAIPAERVPGPLGPRFFAEAAAVYDACHDSAAAMAAMDRGNRLQRERWQRLVPGANPFAKGLVRIQAWLDQSPEPKVDEKEARQPVFIVGFPRSGTTLIGRILAAHGDFAVADERPALRALAEYIDGHGGYPRALEHASAEDLAGWRTRYEEAMPTVDDDLRAVDKMPFNLIHLPLLKSLYPQASVVCAVRDPRDVVLSCLMQPFQLNSAMAHFLELETTVELYDKAMTLWEKARQASPGDVHELRYEALVAAPEQTLKSLCAGLGCDYHSAMLNFHRGGPGAVVTPSRRQVSQPLYDSAVGRWRRYESLLAPYRQTLDRWAARLGYD